MKRFIITNILALAVLPLLACAWVDTHNYYLFCVHDHEEFSERADKQCEENWKSYLGITEERWSYYDADEIIKVARNKGDALMVSYVEHLEQYLNCARNAQNTWDYPTKEEQAEQKRTLESVRMYAASKTKSRLRSQHALLLMRCNMMLGHHQENVSFWEQTASQFINSVYRDMMKNIYAGALLKTGNANKAGELFAEMGDWKSLMTQYYEKRSYAAIRQEYLQNPNSPVLPFLLQDFVNNTQEAVDIGPEGYPSGKLFVRDIQRKEGEQMIKLCSLVVSEGKTQSPALWQSAKAWIEFLYGNQKQGTSDILAAADMNGTEAIKDNARTLMLYMTASQAKPGQAFDDYLADELQWLDSKCATDDHYNRAKDRLIHQVLVPRYANRQETALSLLKSIMCYEYEVYLDTMKIESLQNFIRYRETPAQTPLDRYLKAQLKKEDPNMMNDLIGTKHMRLCEWQQAIEWLKRVPLSYYDSKGYVVYAANRSWTVEPWVTRQFLKESVEYGDTEWRLKSNPKLDFAREMLQMEGELNALSGKRRYQRCYDLAVRYAQAHFTGDCWYLMRDGKSVTDTLRVNETDLAARAKELLGTASQSSDFLLKEKALFALCYGYLYTTPWRNFEWSTEASDYVARIDRQSPQYQAMVALTELEEKNATRTSQYVSRCDGILQFTKTYK